MPQEQCEAAKADLERAKQLKNRRQTAWGEAKAALTELRAAQPPDPKAIAAEEIAVESAHNQLLAAKEEVRECRERVEAFCSRNP
ncbi:hypothetical protein ACFWP3_02215 [Streptomyces sp. NPDC058525]|uniref:hypothetical protein n=1 Tax=Streptomyces sp. NPDC058525 TaxID=3346538 RepID=UPI003661725A